MEGEIETQKGDEKRIMRERGVKRESLKIQEYGYDITGEEEGGGGEMCADDERKNRGGNGGGGRRLVGSGGMSAAPSCQAEKCAVDLSEVKKYHRRHKVCEYHAKAPVVIVAGLRQRFCQQCSRFHELQEFDEAKRSCRRRLAGHNERRRKVATEPHGGEVSSSKVRASTQVIGIIDSK